MAGTGYSLQVVFENYGDAPESEFQQVLESLREEGQVEIRAAKKGQLFYRAAPKLTPMP